MNTLSKKSLAWLLAVIGGVGIYHADANAIEIKDAEKKAAVVKCLVAQGLIVPLSQENWYQINQERLAEALQHAKTGERRAIYIIDMLQSVVGPEINVREVDLFEIPLGTQDYDAKLSTERTVCE